MEDHYHYFFIILVCFLSIETTVLFVSAVNNPKFIACEPKKCGNSNLTISYPFWIPDEHESYCGHPDFQINCSTTATTIDDESLYNQPPLVQILNEGYIIRDIFYDNQSFRVTTFNDPCPTPLRNLTFDYAGSPFSFGPNHAELFFFYNCTLVPTDYFAYALPCFTYNNTTDGHQYQSFATVIHDGGFQYLNSTSEKCGSMVGAPIEQMELASMMKMGYTDVLRRGFVLQWNSSNCRDCEQSGGRCGFDNNFVCFCQDNTDVRHPKTCKGSKKKKTAIGIGAGIGGFILACLLAYLFFYLRRRKTRRSISSNLIAQNITPDSSWKPDPENGSTYFATPIFSYEELEEATNNFDSNRELGDGGFGTVYRGELQDGRVVAVKRLYENNFKRVEQFMNEVNILSLLRHENLVTLYGCTSRHSRELLLVYEYVPNGTVADHIHGELAKAGLATWPIRMNIAIESAGALKYLHASDIIHRDVKTNNILLDKSFHVKVADFGLVRLFPTDKTHVSTAPQGTPGYVDPEYYQCYQLTDKSDVYSFGVVLIELISSKPAVDISRHRHDINLANMAINKIQNHSLSELVDPRLGFETDNQARRMITLVAELAFRCLQQDRDMRPSMVEVLEVLKGIAGEEDNVVKAVEVIDIPADHDVVRLLKNDIAPFSPISVTDKWRSVASTPNTSS